MAPKVSLDELLADGQADVVEAPLKYGRKTVKSGGPRINDPLPADHPMAKQSDARNWKQEKMGVLAGAAHGGAKGITLGTADEIAAGVGATANQLDRLFQDIGLSDPEPQVMDALGGVPERPTFSEDLSEQLSQLRTQDKRAMTDQPLAYAGSELAGDALANVGLGIATGGASWTPQGQMLVGAVSGAGNSEEDSFGGIAKDSATSAGMSGAFGLAGRHAPKLLSAAALGAGAFGHHLGLSDKDRIQLAMGGGSGLVTNTLGKYFGNKNRSAVGEMTDEAAKAVDAQDQIWKDAEAKLLKETEASKKEGLKSFDAMAERRKADAAAKLKAEQKDKAELIKKADTWHGEFADADKQYTKALEAEGKKAQRGLEAELKMEARRKQMSQKEADKAVVDAFEAGEAQKLAANDNMSRAQDESDAALIDAFLAEEAAKKRALSPVASPDEDIDASALGLLGNEAQEAYRYLRSKDPLGLNLDEKARAGVQALLPDYEANANAKLASFAEGKEAALQRIKEKLLAERQAKAAGPRLDSEGTQVIAADPEIIAAHRARAEGLPDLSNPDKTIERGPLPEATLKPVTPDPRVSLGTETVDAIARSRGIDPAVLGKNDVKPADFLTEAIKQRIAEETTPKHFGFRNKGKQDMPSTSLEATGAERPGARGPRYEKEARYSAGPESLDMETMPDGSMMPKENFFSPTEKDLPWPKELLGPEPKTEPTLQALPVDTARFAADAPIRLPDEDFSWPKEVGLAPEPKTREQRINEMVAERRSPGNMLPGLRKAALERVLKGRGALAAGIGALHDPALRANVTGILARLTTFPDFSARYGRILADDAERGGKTVFEKVKELLEKDPEFARMFQQAAEEG